MLKRLRQGFRCGVRRLGPSLVTLAALIALGFGAHAALDWHRHGEAGAGFIHLHVHVGHHHHESPEPDAPPDDRRECGTLTLVLGVAPAPAVATAEHPTLEGRERTPLVSKHLDRRQRLDDAWGPRGPPV